MDLVEVSTHQRSQPHRYRSIAQIGVNARECTPDQSVPSVLNVKAVAFGNHGPAFERDLAVLVGLN